MANYVQLEHYNSNVGQLGISTKVYEFIAEKNIKKVKEILKRDKNNSINVSIKDNTVVYKIYVAVKKGTNVEYVKDTLEENIKNTLLLLCDTDNADINIKVVERTIEK